MYYLNSRYYDPQFGRFINGDDLAYIKPEELNGCNLFSYCNNNPVMFIDPSGHKWWHWLVGGLIIAAGVIVMATCAYGVAALLGVSTSVANSMAIGASIATATTGSLNLFMQGSQGFESFDVGSLIFDMTLSGTIGMLTGGTGAVLGGFSSGAKTVTQLLIHKGIQAGINSLISLGAYTIQSVFYGKEMTLYGFSASVISGFVSGAMFNSSAEKAFILSVGLEWLNNGESVWEIIKRWANNS